MASCRGTNKAGEPCKASAWKNGYCIAHQPEEIRKKVGHASGTRAGSKRDPMTVPALARRIVEANAAAVLAPYLRALGLRPMRSKRTGAIVVVPDPRVRARIYGVSREGIVKMSDYDDLEAMMRAAERLMDRVYGKPKQAVSLGGEEGGTPALIAVPSDSERAAEVAQILAMSGAVKPPATRNGHG